MKKIFYIFILSLLFIGCTPRAKVMRYTTMKFPPTHNIEIFRSKIINKDYIEIGEVYIRLKKSTEENAIALLAEKAKEIGADAIIIMGERLKGIVSIPAGRAFVSFPVRELYAIAIKYK